MSFYFTLSGLPPGMSNQEYNVHFLATSNKAGALELGENIVDELKCGNIQFQANTKGLLTCTYPNNFIAHLELRDFLLTMNLSKKKSL
jgi:hypothetical protein